MTTVDVEVAPIELLDFTPQYPCQSTHTADRYHGMEPPAGEHDAHWWEFNTCGCVLAFCDQAHSLHMLADFWLCGACEKPCAVTRAERITK